PMNYVPMRGDQHSLPPAGGGTPAVARRSSPAGEAKGSTRADFSDDALLGGRLRLLQPQRGHRVGHDAILLAASCPACAGDKVADLGAGVGAAGLALTTRVPADVILVEIDADLAALATENARRNDVDEH